MSSSPRQTADSAQLRRLGEQIEQWIAEALGDADQDGGYQLMYVSGGIKDLLEGELPQPLALAATVGPLRLTEESVALLGSEGFLPEDLTDLKKKVPQDLRRRLRYENAPPPAGELSKQRERLGDLASQRCVVLCAATEETSVATVAADMRGHLDAELVEEATVDGGDWNFL